MAIDPSAAFTQRLALRTKAEDESGTQTSSVVGVTDRGIVEVAGIEPASSKGEPGLLRAQPMVAFCSAPALVIGTSRTGPALVESLPEAKASAGRQAFLMRPDTGRKAHPG